MQFKDLLFIYIFQSKFKCKECPRICDSSDTLTKHIANQHKKTVTIECDFCDETFEKSQERLQHMKTYHRTTKITANTNINTDLQKIPILNCKQCSKRFTQPGNLQNHIQRFHENREKDDDSKEDIKPILKEIGPKVTKKAKTVKQNQKNIKAAIWSGKVSPRSYSTLKILCN